MPATALPRFPGCAKDAWDKSELASLSWAWGGVGDTSKRGKQIESSSNTYQGVMRDRKQGWRVRGCSVTAFFFMAVESLSKKSTDLRVEEEVPIPGQVSGRGNSRCKGPEAWSRSWEKRAALLEQGEEQRERRWMTEGVRSPGHQRPSGLGLILRRRGRHWRALGRGTACPG